MSAAGLNERNKIDPEIVKDIEWMKELVRQYRSGELSDDELTPKRLAMGVYGQRQENELQMFRIKIPYGGLDSEKLRKVAYVVEKYGNNKAHFTTRENIQTHFIKLDNVVEVMEEIAKAGLTTREACGNTVRNIVGCPLSGVCKHELFDITPYAHTVVYHLLRDPRYNQLPRKFKISFSGCPTPCPDCKTNEPVAFIHDMGFIAKRDGERKGFQIWIAGGLGNTPKFAHLLEDFTPVDEILSTTEAILDIFNERGNRKNRNRARIKFLVEQLGIDGFRRLVIKRRREIQGIPVRAPDLSERPVTNLYKYSGEKDSSFDKWVANNVIRQKQQKYSAVIVSLPIGDVDGPTLNELADLVDKYSDGYLRASPNQNIILRWVRNENIESLYYDLKRLNLNEGSADTILDITSCPGTSTCRIGITHSKNLATALRETIINANHLYSELGLTVKISGCPNSCGQHHIADIGFYGTAISYGGKRAPTYQVMVGGGLLAGKPAFGVALGKILAKDTPAALKIIVDTYLDNKEENENFFEYVNRSGKEALKQSLAQLLSLEPDYNTQREYFSDIGLDEEFSVKLMKGDCAR